MGVNVISVALDLPDPDNLAGAGLEWLIFVEHPCLAGKEHNVVQVCGHHFASLAEANFRTWTCHFQTREGIVEKTAVAISYYRQALSLRCDVPKGIDLYKRRDVVLKAFP